MPEPIGASGAVARNIRTITRLDAERQARRRFGDRMGYVVTRFASSIWFLLVHAVWFGGWILYNTQSVRAFDRYPFTFLTFLVSLEAICLSSFILISQRHAERAAGSRAALGLQINLLAEEEMTKALAGIAAIAKRLGIHGVGDDPESREMTEKTDVESLARALGDDSGDRRGP
jgi:uncharacterized membrane protein